MLLDLFMRRLIRIGTLTLRYPDGTLRRYGGGEGPEAGMALRTAAAVRRLALNPGLAAGELYMDGTLEPERCGLYELLDLLVVNLWQGGSHPAERLVTAARTLRRRIDQFNPAPRAKRNVAHHYDLDGRLFSLFLDRDQQYSCAYYQTGQETLEEAQAAKKRHIAAKLKLDRPGLEVLEIGCGWGGMALTLARDWGARVTGITLSEEQLQTARARAAAEGLADRVRFELMDYRAWRRPVDRVLSVAMFEAVGLAHYRRFFTVVRDALRPDGVALVHAIGRAGGPGATNPWLAKYIFPGGYSPALSEVVPAVEKAGLWITDIEILRLHYALTLREWRHRFAASRDAIEALYDERFCRMFEFYLASCEITFRRTDHMNWQLQLTRERETLPLTRDWMLKAERASIGA
ncbi:SAM-dependent methyltransferase [Roseicella aquatilis]|uniref:Class I SAM-dependent methyltransferase n=1 Tax=Roseicella aquatilis TaxID=2527868 RepID=A0A4R4DGN6_9PROT|nr:cyclopropane-fatty-acyl-phospholipid synthase family protein [Roseicella aquatilis]TCZ58737.1 class I SAM-dependent methyltransferase [Roseicella aquatilis]